MNMQRLLAASLFPLLISYGAQADFLDRSDWQISASNNSGALSNLYDGNNKTRWTTKAVKQQGQYIEIDLAGSYLIDQVLLNSWNSPADYPEAYSVYTSIDGESWGEPVAFGVGQTITEVNFPATQARYVKIIQEGTSSQYWWSIDELYINQRVTKQLDSSNWSLSASSNSNKLVNALDGDVSTRWDTGVQQADGQYLLVDLGSEQTFDRIVLDSEASKNDYPRNYAISVSDDNSNWQTVVYNGAGDSATTTIDFHDKTARYIKIEQTGSSSKYYWSVHELAIYANAADSETGNTGFTLLNSISELRTAMTGSGGKYKMAPGHYIATDFTEDGTSVLYMSGSNNIIDLSDVTIDIPTSLLNTAVSTIWTGDYHWVLIEGHNNTLINGNFISSYPNGDLFVSDFKTHNDDRERQPRKSATYFKVWGDGNSFINNTIVVRGSFPYGYGDMFGKGSGSTFGLRKHCAFQVVGDNTLIDGMDITQLAFCHAIFMQGADNTTIRNTVVKGRVRAGADMYDDGSDSLPDQVDYIVQQPYWYADVLIPEDKVYNLTEDGIRSYASGTKADGTVADTGSVVIENTQVINMRNCYALVQSSQATVNNVTAKGCAESSFSIPSNGSLTNAVGDAAFAPLVGMPYGNESNIYLDITIKEPPYSTGPSKFTNIAGSGHTIILRSDGNQPADDKPITVGYAWDRWEWAGDTSNLYRHGAEDNTIYNFTDREVELTSYADDSNTVISSGGACVARQPEGLNTFDVGEDSAGFIWSSRSGNISHYSVRYSADSGENWITQNIDAPAISTVISGLSAGTEYQWQIRSVCSDGSGSDYVDAFNPFTTKASSVDEPITYTVSVASADNGSISPSGSLQFVEGQTQSFNLEADTGYQVADLLVNGVSMGALSSYTLTDISADTVISASFEKIIVDEEETDPETQPEGEYTEVSAGFSYTGSGSFKWKVQSISSFINSWNLQSLTINGQQITNNWYAVNELPAAIDGYYYLEYTGNFAWSHIEME